MVTRFYMQENSCFIAFGRFLNSKITEKVKNELLGQARRRKGREMLGV